MHHWRVVVLCLVACSAAPPAREVPTVTPPVPVVPADASAALDARIVEDAPVAADVPERCVVYDPKNYACRMCTEGAGVPNCPCPEPPDVEVPSCLVSMPCPAVPDRRVRSCRSKFPPCPDVDHPDPANPNCPPSVVHGRVIAVEVTKTGDTLIRVDAGAKQGISASWRATLLRDGSDDALPDGVVTIVRVTKWSTTVKVQVTVDVVKANPRIRFERR